MLYTIECCKPTNERTHEIRHRERLLMGNLPYPTCCIGHVASERARSQPRTETPGIPLLCEQGADLRESDVRYDDTMQSTRSILWRFGFVTTGMVLIFEMFIGFAASAGRLPRHGSLGHTDGSF